MKTSAKKYPKPNEHGTYSSSQAQILAYKNDRTRANIELLEIGPALWISAIDVQLSNCGYGEPLSKTGRNACTTRDSALVAAVQRITSYVDHTDAPDAPQVKRWAKDQLQMKLF